MSEWDKLSDRIIDRLILVSLYGDGDKDIEKSWKRGDFNYCNSWADMGPIISKMKFDIFYTDEGGYVQDRAKPFICEFKEGKELRAAAIVYLEMNGVKP